MKNQKEYYWKVLHINSDNSLRSAVISGGKYSLKYEFGKRITAPLNGLLVFETRKQARKFIKYNPSSHPLKVFKVKVFGDEIPNQPYYDICDMKYDIINEFLWTDFPDGTHSFPSLEIIEKAR